MRKNALREFAKLRQKLLQEKSQVEARLAELNEALGTESSSSQTSLTSSTPVRTARGRKPGGRRGRNTMSLREAVLQALSQGPVARKDLAAAVEAVGYKFKTDNPLNSIGSVLYGKNTPVKNKDGKFYIEGK